MEACTCAEDYLHPCPQHPPKFPWEKKPPKLTPDDKLQITCTDSNCPERKSVCCYAISRKDGKRFLCSECGKPYVGGQCRALDDKQKEELSMSSESLEDIIRFERLAERKLMLEEIGEDEEYNPRTAPALYTRNNLRQELREKSLKRIDAIHKKKFGKDQV